MILKLEDLDNFLFIGYDDIKLLSTIIKSGGKIFYDSSTATIKFIDSVDNNLFICYARKIIVI